MHRPVRRARQAGLSARVSAVELTAAVCPVPRGRATGSRCCVFLRARASPGRPTDELGSIKFRGQARLSVESRGKETTRCAAAPSPRRLGPVPACLVRSVSGQGVRQLAAPRDDSLRFSRVHAPECRAAQRGARFPVLGEDVVVCVVCVVCIVRLSAKHTHTQGARKETGQGQHNRPRRMGPGRTSAGDRTTEGLADARQSGIASLLVSGLQVRPALHRSALQESDQETDASVGLGAAAALLNRCLPTAASSSPVRATVELDPLSTGER